MSLFLNIFSFSFIVLILNCFFIFFFKKWIGPQGVFYMSITSYFIVVTTSILEFYFILTTGSYFFIDFGRFFFCLNLLDSHLVFCIDDIALILTIMVSVLTSFALFFGVEYMMRDAFITRLLYLLNLFATSVIFLFIAYDFFLILIAWELIGLFSFLLVNFYSMRVYTIKAALKTFILSRVSDMFLFVAFVLIVLVFNTTDLSIIFLELPFFLFHRLFLLNVSIHFLSLLATLIVLASVVKAAQFFFHVWLPDAMEAPTPASALIHSSTLVIMGVFLIIRFNVLFEFSLISNYILAILGAVTIAFGAITAIFQNDIKKLIAYSTISQIGYLICGCGFGAYDEVLLYLIMHAFNKAFLFILAGFVVHYFSGNTDMRQMGGLFLYTLDITAYILAITINLAGLPYSAGFYAKEFLIFQILKDDYISIIVQVSWLLSFIFTPLYMLILLFFVFFDFKKSNIKNYKSTWSIRPNLNLTLKTINFNIFSKYQITLLTSRLVIYILLAVYLVYSSLGDYLVSLIFNYSLNFDNTTNLFFNIKNKQTYLLYSFSYYTLLSLTYIIFTSVTFSYLFLEKLQINQTYIQINQLTYTVNLLFILIVLLLAYYNIYFIMLLGLLF